MKPRVPLLAAALAGSLVLAGCGSGSSTTADATDGPREDGGADAALSVTAAFYPLELAVQRIGGERVAVSALTQPGADPHDAELSPRQVAELTETDLVVFLSGFQPAVDDAVATVAADAALDVADFADLTVLAEDDGHDHSGESEEEHAEHSHEGGTDPHFWLDPTRYAAVAEAIADRLVALDPEGTSTYEAGLAEFTGELTALDEEFAAGLQTCTSRDLVTGHAAFGYLADRYDLRQKGIAGLTPESEPSAAQVRDLVQHVRETGVTTVYAETLVDPSLAETIAREAGAEVRVLDPIEGITDASAGSDYFEIMRTNLETLREGQGCSSTSDSR
jgi:zinc transport system substrate-binding protein